MRTVDDAPVDQLCFALQMPVARHRGRPRVTTRTKHLRHLMRTSILCLVIFLFSGEQVHGQAQFHPPTPDQDFRLSVDVDLVELHAIVSDRKGQFVLGLRQQDFSVFEDGVKQEIRIFQREDIPVTVGLVVDHSGSMHAKLPHVAAAARTFVSARRPDDQMFVVNFNEYVVMGLPEDTPFSNNAYLVESAILNTRISGMTALYDAISLAMNHLSTGDRDKRVLIVLSDGADNASKTTLAEILLRAGQSNALIYTVGLFDEADPDRNPRVLRRLASATGGSSFIPNEIEDVLQICEQIAQDRKSVV